MPLLAATSSELFSRHPDWFVRDARNAPWTFRGWSPAPDHLWACLDFSLPAVCDHLHRVFVTLAGWGFRYFKLDGWFTATNGRRSDPTATATADVRTCLRIIRDAVGDAIVLGCGSPFLPSIGLIDHARVSTDTGKRWRAWGLPTETSAQPDGTQPCDPMTPCLENALHGSLGAWWLYDRWFRADPDCIMARDENTELTAGEARLSALSGIVSGVVVTSDRLDRMHDARVRLLEVAAHTRLNDPRPLDGGDHAWPRVYGGCVNGNRAAAVFNTSDQPGRWSLRDLGLRGQSAETLHPLGVLASELHLEPHDAALVVETGAT